MDSSQEQIRILYLRILTKIIIASFWLHFNLLPNKYFSNP